MVLVDNFSIRVTKKSDENFLIKWLDDPEILRWFPMCDMAEIKDSVRVWLDYAKYNSALTACVNDTPVGSILLYLQSFAKLSHQCLFAIIVDKNFRGKKIGSALIKEAENLAKEKFNIEMFHIEVYEGNPAKKLYERLGFKEYGLHKKFLKELDGTYLDKHLMQKIL